MVSMRHPLRNETYTVVDGALVQVENHDQGITGVFQPSGEWVSGDLRSADLHLLEWMGALAAQQR
jgi:hypothetical protein